MLASTALLSGLVDYAGLFPPAGLGMPAAVCNYAAYRRGPHAWMLGRMIVPATRLAEFEAVRRAEDAGDSSPRWRLSALLGSDVDAEIDAALAFNAAAAVAGSPVALDAWEVKAQSPDDIFRVSARVPGRVRVSFEIPVHGDVRPARAALLDAIFHAGATAKARTGGVTAATIPTTAEVAAFLWDCARVRVPFKATAGHHHRVRGEYPLTYASDSPTGVMHGFLNVFVAAALARAEAAHQAHAAGPGVPAILTGVLDERDPSAFSVGPETVRWRDSSLGAAQLGDTRTGFALSFGSCSFEEPVAELLATGVPL